MIHFKNHNPGMSLIEVIVALLIVSLVIVASFKTQSALLRSATKTVNQLQVVATIKNYFMQATRDKFFDKDTPQEKTVDFPVMKLVYKATPAKDSSIFKNITGMVTEKITATWHEFGRDQTTSMVRFSYKKPEEKKS
jgi:prepilin-type N-terminal cleavage/methylation domain-containing protein